MTQTAAPPAELPAPPRAPGRLSPRRLAGLYRAEKEDRRWLTRGAILYTTCDEDSHSELLLLDLSEDDDVVSITGSGCRSLNLLIGGPRSVVSVDANPLQNHVLELKVGALRALSHPEMLRFLGAHRAPGEERLRLYARVREHLSPDALRFWDRNPAILARGMLFTGAHESFYRRFIGPSIRILRHGRLRKLYAFDDVEAQSRFYDTKWNHIGWKLAVRLLARPTVVRLLLNDPSYFAQVNRPESFAHYLLRRLRNVFAHHLARDNDVFTMYVFGRYLNDDAMPMYLLEEHFETIRSRLDALQIVTAPIGDHLASLPDQSVSKISLSDITGWASEQEFRRVLEESARALRPGGRVCYRCFLTDRPVPEDLRARLRPLDDLARQATDTDRAFAFEFVVAEA